MKKTLILVSLLCLSSAVSLFAAKPLAVKSGDISVLKKKSNALLEIDYSAAKVGDKTFYEYLQGRGDDFVRDWPNDSTRVASYFTSRFNSRNKKGMQITADAANATYKIIIQVDKLDMGNGASAMLPFAPADAGGVIMSGMIDVVDIGTDEIVCTLSVNEVKGNGNVSETLRLGMMYFELATNIFYLK